MKKILIGILLFLGFLYVLGEGNKIEDKKHCYDDLKKCLTVMPTESGQCVSSLLKRGYKFNDIEGALKKIISERSLLNEQKDKISEPIEK